MLSFCSLSIIVIFKLSNLLRFQRGIWGIYYPKILFLHPILPPVIPNRGISFRPPKRPEDEQQDAGRGEGSIENRPIIGLGSEIRSRRMPAQLQGFVALEHADGARVGPAGSEGAVKGEHGEPQGDRRPLTASLNVSSSPSSKPRTFPELGRHNPGGRSTCCFLV